MLNAISANFLRSYQTAGQFDSQAMTAASNKNVAEQNPLAMTANTTVEISEEGLALSQNVDDEQKLSTKAQNYLEKLREKYGDYNFVVSNDMDTTKTLGSDKEYSVMFSTEELEKMAEDDEYAEKVMGQVGNAVDMLKNISEKDLGEGVKFSQLGVSIDSEGNMTLFAQLEKLSEQQQKRFEEAKEKAAERQQEAKEKAKPDDSEDGMPVVFKSADVEAANEEELLAKIFGINWDEIPEEEALI
ncbi:MAG: hypothetical protein IJK81_00950 [Selenomonadaceae bacterium]|nr:hypothetical protein [Selenomonadaceae bacterium]